MPPLINPGEHGSTNQVFRCLRGFLLWALVSSSLAPLVVLCLVAGAQQTATTPGCFCCSLADDRQVQSAAVEPSMSESSPCFLEKEGLPHLVELTSGP